MPRSKIDFYSILTLKFTKIELKFKQRENVIQLKTGHESRTREFQGVSNSVSILLTLRQPLVAKNKNNLYICRRSEAQERECKWEEKF